jgi:hypothetical protein
MERKLHGAVSYAHQLGNTNDKKRVFIGTLQIARGEKQEGRNSPRQELTSAYYRTSNAEVVRLMRALRCVNSVAKTCHFQCLNRCGALGQPDEHTSGPCPVELGVITRAVEGQIAR